MLQSSTLKFLRDLAKNNNKPWFDANRPRYEEAKKDFEAFIGQLIARHSKRDPDLKELTAKGAMFRINRDIRFSKDKSPYKTNLAASFARGGKKSMFAGYYFHLEPGGKSMVGGGLWQPMPPEVKKVRQEIDYSLDDFKKIVEAKKFKTVYGDLYKGEDVSLAKMPQGYDKDNPAAEFLKLKSWIGMRDIKDAELSSGALLDLTLEALTTLQPLLQFLNRSIE